MPFKRNGAEGRIITLHTPSSEVRIDSAGGVIESLRVDGVELLLQERSHPCFPMAPWCGRLQDGELTFGGETYTFERTAAPHAIHGIVRDDVWAIELQTPTELVLTQDLGPAWPFGGRVRQRFVLHADSLDLHFRVSTDGQEFPAQAGWHPWFNKSLGAQYGELSLDFTPGWQEERDENFVLAGNRIDPEPRPWDDCFGTPGGLTATLTWAGFGSLTVTSDAEWAVVYDHGDAALCVEPQSGPPNGLNTDPFVVSPERELVVQSTWRWTTEPVLPPATTVQ